ncbi:MAG TPA: hypothetical protein VMS17_15380, partial [Gemmataceae bacterium]|nr:hypothetical protein [Gemmataceae bacterium]
ASLAEVVGSQEELKRLTADLTAKLGPAAPAMTTVSGIFEECRALLDQIQKKRPPSGGNADKEAVDGAPASSQGALAPAATRAEIYRRLEQAALALKALEPHSPIPYLLLRAVELGQMAFPQLMQELVRDSGTLNELKREFGIKNPPSSD